MSRPNLNEPPLSIRRGWWDHHWIAFLALLPFGLMLSVHRLLGLSDAMLAAPRPGQPFWPFYNLTMVLVLYLGVAGFLAHAFAMHHRGWGWVIAKCLGLVLAWTGMILTLEALAA